METAIEEALFVQALECTFTHHPELFNASFVKEIIDGGITAINETVASPTADFNGIVKWIYKFRRKCDAMGVLVATTVSDIERAKHEGKLAAIFGLQELPFVTSTYPDDLCFIEMLYGLRVRIAQLTYQRKNLLGDGCGERTDSGLSKFGIQVIEEMNRLGMLIDLSHVGQKSSMEAIEISKDPVVFSHSNCLSVTNNVRNISDEQIKALAEKDGVMGICAFVPLLNMERPATMEDYLDHMIHVAELVGVNHVGVGLDSSKRLPLHPDIAVQEQRYVSLRAGMKANHPGLFAPWMNFKNDKGLTNNQTVKAIITKGLANRGYSSSEIEKILGKNFMRVFKKVWKA